jgi:hypothetical protein
LGDAVTNSGDSAI